MYEPREQPTSLSIEHEGPVRSCAVRGVIEAWNCRDLLRQIESSSALRTLLDLSEVEQVDSIGLGALIEAHKRLAHAGGALALVNPSPAVRRLLDTTRLLRFFTVLDGPEAIAAFRAAAQEPVDS